MNPPLYTPFHTRRDPLILPDQSARIHALAKRILHEVGIEIKHAGVLARLQQEGLRSSGERVFFDPVLVDEYVEEMRQVVAPWTHHSPAPNDGPLGLSVSSYSLYVHDLETGRVIPYSTERLIEMTKLIDTLADERVSGTPPGIPTEVHPDLQPVAQYRIAALYARQGATPVDPTSAKTVNYLLDMAEVMGRPIDGLPVYVPTPLRLGGESLDVVLACLDRLEYISVTSMPSLGVSAPLQPFGALALAAAEVIGGMIAVKIATGKPVTCHVDILPFDLRAGAMVFGSPENLLFQMLCADYNRFYGWGEEGGPGNIHVMAKLPDCQSASEKASIMALGAALGAHHFSCAGTLSLDEIFSPEQLLLDCEIRDWVQRAIQGVALGEEDVQDWLKEIRLGIERGFMGRDSTLDHHKEHTWYPRWFQRGAAGQWFEKGEPKLSDRLQNEVRRRIASHHFELDAERRREIERIYRQAELAVG